MNFYESLTASLSEHLRANAGLNEQEKQELISGMMNVACAQALQSIREVLKDDTLDDPSCFQRIEKIVEIYEALGSNGGGRHDFG